MNLLELVEAGDTAGVLQELGTMTLEQRAPYAAELLARHEAMSFDAWLFGYSDKIIAHCSAELGCQVTPEAAAAWLVACGDRSGAYGCGWMVDVVNLYPAEWRAELVARIAGRESMGRRSSELLAVAEHIIRDLGCPLPTSDVFIRSWLGDRSNRGWSRVDRPARVLGIPKGSGLLEQLRKDDFTPTLLPLAVARRAIDISGVRREILGFADKGVIDRGLLSRRTFADLVPGSASSQDTAQVLEAGPLTPAEHARMTRERVALVEPLIARLLQDGTRMELEAPLTTLRSLAPPPDENAPFMRDHVAMLDLSALVASYGQDVLIGLDEAGVLEADVRTEACERVLLRPEKKLVRTQLSWLDSAARRDAAASGQVLVDAAMAFQHPDMALQERALNLVARLLPGAGGAGDAVLPELRTAAGSLSPGLAARAAEVFGGSPDGGVEPFAEVLPVVPEPQPVPGPIETVAEVAQEVAAVVAGGWDVAAFERALDGLVRHAHLDRGALSDALKPVLRRERGGFEDGVQADLYDVAAVVRGNEPRRHAIHIRSVDPAWASVAGTMLRARLIEAIEVIESGTQPFLLAVPTLDTGVLDAAVLVERIAEFEELGITPAPVDLAQALLRVDPAPDEQVRRAAEELRSEAGQRLARWLREGGLPHQDSTPQGWPVSDPTSAEAGRWYPAGPGVAGDHALPPVAAALVGRDESEERGLVAAPFCVAQLPHHRDEVAARIAKQRVGRLPSLIAESGGPAGYATHWLIARNLNVDALLVLAARDQLDSRLLGGQLQALYGKEGDVKPVADRLRVAAETGAYATAWSVLEAALPGLLRGTPPRGAGALLALAVECASRCRATGPIPEVGAVAERKGSTQTIKNARLLRDVLRRGERPS